MSQAPENPQQPEPGASTTRDEVRVRRAPKYPVFIFAGILLGVVATFIAVSLAPGDDGTSFATAFGYFVLYGIAIGALLGAVVAVILDAIANRRARTVETERTVVENPDEADGSSERSAESDAVDGELE